MKYKTSQYCPNCHFPLPYKAKFCAHCGQKNDNEIPSVAALFKQVWYRVLHLESRSLRFMWRVFVPGYVTREFFSGHRKRYPHPVRFFFIVMFLFLFTINHLKDPNSLRIGTQVGTTGAGIKNAPDPNTDPFSFYDLGKTFAEVKKMRQDIDSLPAEFQTPLVRQAVDSLLYRKLGNKLAILDKFQASLPDSSRVEQTDSISLNLGLKSIRVATSDAFLCDAETIAQKYHITGWLDKIALRQGIKTMQNPKSLVKAYLGSLAWTLLALVTLMAAVLTILYRRQNRYYVEHFILLLNDHSALFLLLTFAMWIDALLPLGYLWIPLIIWLAISPVLSMRRFYRQSWRMTLLKSAVVSIAYLFGFIALFILGIFAAFFFF